MDRTTYYELDVSMATSVDNVHGSCNSWRSLLVGPLTASNSFLKAHSVELIAQDALGGASSAMTASRVRCSNQASSGSIVAALLGGATVESSPVEVTCDDHVWRISTCPGGDSSVAAVCVDCADPCSASAHCSSSFSSNQEAAFTVAPCVASKCTVDGATVSSALRVLSVGFEEQQPAPTILSTAVSTSKTSVTVAVMLDSQGTVYCAALEQKSSVTIAPSSLGEIILQNHIGSTDANNGTDITIRGLFAATDYHVYCMSVSPIGVQMALVDVLSSPSAVTTDCCNAVKVESSVAYVSEQDKVANFLTITLPSRPRKDLQLFITALDGEGTEVASNPFFPSSFTVKGVVSGGSLELTSTLQGTLEAGTYTFVVSFAGETAHKYEAEYARSNKVEILVAAQALPAPVLSAAAFVLDGSYITITFDSKTDQGGVTSDFACSLLFDFACAETSTCRWSSASVVNAYLDKSPACASLDDTLTLAEGSSIKALCEGAGCDTSSWDSVAATTLTIAAPSDPISPSVSIASPTSIGGCNTLTLDVSGSRGSGGRDWEELSLSVESTATRNVSDLERFLREEYQPSPPTPIPAELLQTGFSYNFAVKLCNFLGRCSTGSRRVSVLSTVIPSLTLPGSSVRSTRRSSVLSITSDAFVVDCDGGTTRAGLTYAWNVKRNGALDLSIVSASKDPSRLRINAYTLTVGGVYDISLTVTIAGNLQSASTSVQVVVEEGSIVALVAGGSSRTMRVEESLSLDASSSYDEDQLGVTGIAAGLQFTWSCVQVAPIFRSECDSVFDSAATKGSSSDVFEITALSSAADSEVEISLSLLDSSLARAAEATVTVSVLPALAPVVSVVSNLGASAVMNSGKRLQLTGTVSFPEGYEGTATWSLAGGVGVDLPSAAESALEVSFPASDTSRLNTIYLALAANSLPAGFKLTFYLTAVMPTVGASVAATVGVRVNSPPLPGRFFVTPDSGMELSDGFKFVASAWSDQDLPIQYQFSYISTAGTIVVLSSRSESAFGESQLPAGAQSEDFAVGCVAEIFDSYLAASTSFYSVVVNKGEERNSSETLSYVENILEGGSASADGMKQSNALGAYLLNAVNCSLAPDCSALNRAACYRTAHTCGDCVSTDFIGEEGDSNQACVARNDIIADRKRLLTAAERQVCSDVSDCTGFNTCDNGVCSAPQKQCSGNCSGHGVCAFVDAKFGTAMSDCKVGSSKCLAVCDCEEAYWGSDTCAITADELDLKRSSRLQIIKSIRRLMDLEDPDSQTIIGWMNILLQVSQIPDELSEEGSTALMEAATALVGFASEAGVDGDAILELLASVDAAVSSVVSSSRRRRRLLTPLSPAAASESHRLLFDTILDTQSFLQQYSDLLSAGLLPGQDAVQAVLSQFRISVQKLSVTSAGGNQSFALPSSALESWNGEQADAVRLPVGEGSEATVSLRSIRAQLLNEEAGLNGELSQFQSNGLSLELSELPCSSSSCWVEIVLQLSSEYNDILNTAPEQGLPIYETSCGDNDYSVHNYSCPDSTFMLVNCTGTESLITSQCPTTTYQPACNALSGLQTEDAQCGVVAVTDTNITCSCPLSAVTSRRKRRRWLQSGTADGDEDTENDEDGTQGEVSVSYVAMLETVESSFVDTVLGAEDLNSSDVGRSWSVLVTLGLFIGFAVAAMFLSHFADERVKKSQSNVNPLGQETAGSDRSNSVMARAMSFTVGTAATKLHRNNQQTMQIENPDEQQDGGSKSNKGRSVTKRAPLKKIKRGGGGGVMKNADLSMAEEALPRILGSRSLTSRIADEIRNRHRWFGIYFHYSPHFPRSLRVASLVTNVVIMLFIQSLTYALTNPDNGECESYKTRSTCLEEESPYATGETKCSWAPKGNSEDKGSCSFVEPDSDVKVILFVAIFSAIISTPVALLADWVIMYVLSAPTRKALAVVEKKPLQTKAPVPAVPADVALAPGAITSAGGATKTASVNLAVRLFRSKAGTAAGAGGKGGGLHVQSAAKRLMTAQEELRRLIAALTGYRNGLTEQQQVEFDGTCVSISLL